MPITPPLSRRTFLRGVGVTMALPWLESLPAWGDEPAQRSPELPQISMDFPEYRKVNREYEIAVLIKTLDEKEISESINRLLDDEDAYDRLKENCKKAKHVFNWQEEEPNLLRFHHRLLA